MEVEAGVEPVQDRLSAAIDLIETEYHERPEKRISLHVLTPPDEHAAELLSALGTQVARYGIEFAVRAEESH